MAGQHHRFNEHELGQTPDDGEGQGGLPCCSPWDRRVGHDWATELKTVVICYSRNGKLIQCVYMYAYISIGVCICPYNYIYLHTCTYGASVVAQW